jgi:AraC family transcriptional regulator, arabinose operon regulatory protein
MFIDSYSRMPVCTIMTHHPHSPRPGRWDTGWRTLPMVLAERPLGGAWMLDLDGPRPLRIPAGALAVVPAGWRHRLRKPGPDPAMTSCWCYLRWSDATGAPLPLPSRPMVLHGEAPALIDELGGGPGIAAQARQQRAAWHLLELLAAHQPAAPPAGDPRIARLHAWLEAHLHQPLRRKDLAAEADVSCNRLHDLCTAATGLAPMRLLAARRIARAQELLLGSDATMGEIAERCGYSSPFWFSRAFRAAGGQTPSAYRAAHRGR